jgi:hypothetical protein
MSIYNVCLSFNVYLWRKPDQNELGEKLDMMSIMILDKNLHDDCGITNEIFDIDFFLNQFTSVTFLC